mgnify:CR=1 FL=1
MVLVVSALAVILLVWLGSGIRVGEGDTAPSSVDPSKCLIYVDGGATKGSFGMTKIKGELHNRCGRDIAFVKISFKVYDKIEGLVDTASANQSNLANGETWHFEALTFRSDAYRFKLAEISAR